MKTVILFTKAADARIADAMVADLHGMGKQFVTVSDGMALIIDLDHDKVGILKTRSDAVRAFVCGEARISENFQVLEPELA